mgnify:CR=1 FL=1
MNMTVVSIMAGGSVRQNVVLTDGDLCLCIAEGKIYSWGKAARGRLGREDLENSLPSLVLFKDVGRNIMSAISISCSHGATLLAMRCQ